MDFLNSIRETLPVVVGVFVAVVGAALSVPRAMKHVDEKTRKGFMQDGRLLPRPTMIPKEVWEKEIMAETPGNGWLGTCECVVFFASLWIPGAWPVAASWLAFKLASKWDSWKTLGEIPRRGIEVTIKDEHRETKEQPEHLEDLRARVFRTGLMHRKFILGTAANIAWAIVGVGFGQAIAALWRPVGLFT